MVILGNDDINDEIMKWQCKYKYKKSSYNRKYKGIGNVFNNKKV